MLLLNVVTQIPQLNMAKLFSLESEINDPERQLLANAATSSPSYSRQMDEEDTLPTTAASAQQNQEIVGQNSQESQWSKY